MLILNQDRNELINLKNVCSIFIRVYNSCVSLETEEYTLGDYSTEERAREILEEIGQEYCFLTNEEKGYVANGMYYMPEE